MQEQEFRDSSYIGFSRKSKCYSMRELTKGSPAKVIMTFALPIIFGNLLQQLYNLADGKIVSTYVGTQAFAAVGATAVIANLIIGFVNGVTQGFGIPISRCFGAGDYKNMRRYVAGSFIMTVAMTLILTVGALLGIEGLLYILDTPADIMEEALQYIRIIIMGTAFISLYNYSANILRAVGESRIFFLCIHFPWDFAVQRMRPILPSVLQEFCVWHTCFLGSGNLYQRGRNGRCRGESIRR